MGSEVVAGHWVHSFHQSDLKSFALCLERGRASYFGEVPRVENAAAGMGTALHAAIEASIDSFNEGQGILAAGSMLDFAMREFGGIMNTPGAEWGKVRPDKVSDILARACMQYVTVVEPQLDPVRTEVEFDGVPLYEDGDRTILLGGIIDCIDARLGLIDWKLIARSYRAWELRRWDIQSTVYDFAATKLGLYPPGTQGNFRFGTFVKGKDFEWVDVQRTAGHHKWLQHYVKTLAVFIETHDHAGPWPLSDDGWWCSKDWCPLWDECKGKFLGA